MNTIRLLIFSTAILGQLLLSAAIANEPDRNELKNANHGLAPESLPEPLRWAIWRKQFSPYFRSLETDEAWALDAMVNHLNFGEICAGLCHWLPDEQAAPRAATLLRGWVDEGWIASLETA